MANGRLPKQVIASYRKGNEKSMSPKSFKEALVKEFSMVPEIKSKIDSNQELTCLVYYLIRDEDQRVSFDKLIEALD